MPNVRTMAPVGIKNISTVEKQLKTGYLAQGFAVAQTIIAHTINTAQQLSRAVESSWDLSNQARDEVVKVLNDWKKGLTANAKGNANLEAGGMTERRRARLATSATTRTSEFAQIMKAMNNGFSRETLREKTGVVDTENIGFHVVVELARLFNAANASAGVGRPALAFNVKLANWLAKQEVAGKDAEDKAAALNALAAILPHEAGTPEQVVLHRRADDKG